MTLDVHEPIAATADERFGSLPDVEQTNAMTDFVSRLDDERDPRWLRFRDAWERDYRQRQLNG